jgi:hypothetical protein
MVSGGDTGDKRGPVSGRSLKDAHDKATGLIEGNNPAKDARTALITAGIDEAYLDILFRNAMYYYWHIQKRIEAELGALAAAGEAVNHALWLTDWVNGLAEDMPVIFDINEGPPAPYPSLKSDDILDALKRVGHLAKLRSDIARNAEGMLGFTRHRGTKGKSAKREASGRFAIGHLAYMIKGMDPKKRLHNDHVRAIARVLFPGTTVTDRALEGGRERAMRMDDRIELWLFPEVG